MSPERAIFPMMPEPGATGLRSSSRTTDCPMTETVGPLFIAVCPGLISDIPLLPVSDDPMASVIMMLGSRAKNSSLTGELKRAADETTAYRLDRS